MNTNYKKNKEKNIFIKNKLINKDLSDESDKSENLSDELNKLTCNINKSNKQNDFNLINIYNEINELFLYNYTNCKITGEIISFKISDSNAWISVKTDEFQISCIFWKITLDKNFNLIKLTKPGDKFIIEGKFNIMKKNLNIYFNIKSMIKFGRALFQSIKTLYKER